MIDVSILQLLLLAITGWLDRRDREAMAYLSYQKADRSSKHRIAAGSRAKIAPGVSWD